MFLCLQGEAHYFFMWEGIGGVQGMERDGTIRINANYRNTNLQSILWDLGEETNMLCQEVFCALNGYMPFPPLRRDLVFACMPFHAYAPYHWFPFACFRNLSACWYFIVRRKRLKVNEERGMGVWCASVHTRGLPWHDMLLMSCSGGSKKYMTQKHASDVRWAAVADQE